MKKKEKPTDAEIKTKKIKNQLKMKKSARNIIIALIAIILIVIVVLITRNKYEEMTEYTIKNYELYQYFGGIKFEYTGELSLKNNGEITELKYKDIEIETDSTPIYFSQKDNEMLLPKSMGLYIPHKIEKNYKVPYFSRILVEETQTDFNAFLVREPKNLFLDKSFLYDGKDMYVFLYETKIHLNNQTIDLSPLSYITVVYGSEVTYYNKKLDKFKIIDNVKGDVVAELNGYKINLSTDMIMYENNNKLLIKNVDNLKTFTG